MCVCIHIYIYIGDVEESVRVDGADVARVEPALRSRYSRVGALSLFLSLSLHIYIYIYIYIYI